MNNGEARLFKVLVLDLHLLPHAQMMQRGATYGNDNVQKRACGDTVSLDRVARL